MGEADVVVGVDLGSVRCGVAVICAGAPTWAATVAVTSPGATVLELLAAVDGSGARVVAAEWSRVYVPDGIGGGRASGMAQAHETMAILLDRLGTALESRNVALVKLHPSTVRARLGVVRAEGESADGAVRRTLAERLGAVASGWSPDEADAVAVGLAAGLPDPARARGARSRGTYRRKHGGRYQRKGHPSDAAFEVLLASRGVVE